MQDIFKKFERKFGGGGGGPIKGLKTIIALGAIVLFFVSAFYTVAPDEQGVVKRFGEVVRVTNPGPHFRVPILETVYKPQVTKVHPVAIGFRRDPSGRAQVLPREALMLTGDENILQVETVVQYRIQDAKAYLFNVASIEATIKKSSEAAIREVLGKTNVDDALTTGKQQIQAETQANAQAILDSYDAGVEITTVQLKDVSPPKEVVAAFKDVASAKEDRERLIRQAQSYENDIIPRAKGQAAQTVNEAEAFAQARVARAEGEADRFLKQLKEYRRGKNVIRKRIYIETMEEILPKMDKVIIEGSIAGGILPYLPLSPASRVKGNVEK
ncbi:MAG TPA: FtsH protease activity modulator HflK [Nitrospirales bacterium]|nr:FtsH protease activity modulator HflK [Nitrospirales bacterium]